MALSTWPEGFPAPELSSYSPAVTDTRQTSSMSIGHSRVRRLSTQRVGNVQAKYYLSDGELTSLLDFYDSEVNGGADWFTVPLKTDGPVTDHEARFRAPPTYVAESRIRWGVEVQFEVRRRL